MNILVTGGGTVAPIDDVRSITNTSTGRFSAAITEAALRRGAAVWHLHTPGAALPFEAAARLDPDAPIDAELDRLRGLRAELDRLRPRLSLVPLRGGTVPEYVAALSGLLVGRRFDAVFLAMAVSDYAPEPAAGKLDSGGDELIITCRRVPKVIRSVRDLCPDAYLVGFKLTSGASDADMIGRASRANEVNRTDLTVANDLQPYRRGRHTIHLVRPGEPAETLGPGGDIADGLVGRVWAWAAASRRGEVR